MLFIVWFASHLSKLQELEFSWLNSFQGLWAHHPTQRKVARRNNNALLRCQKVYWISDSEDGKLDVAHLTVLVLIYGPLHPFQFLFLPLLFVDALIPYTHFPLLLQDEVRSVVVSLGFRVVSFFHGTCGQNSFRPWFHYWIWGLGTGGMFPRILIAALSFSLWCPHRYNSNIT